MGSEKKHNCEDIYTDNGGGYGCAVTYCNEGDDGKLWVGNGEYGNQVNFCPFCGYPAKVKITGVYENAWLQVNGKEENLGSFRPINIPPYKK